MDIWEVRRNITPAALYCKQQSCTEGLMRKVGPSFYERVFGGSRFRSLRYMYSSSVIFRECHLYDPKLADGICAPLSADVSRPRVISPLLAIDPVMVGSGG